LVSFLLRILIGFLQTILYKLVDREQMLPKKSEQLLNNSTTKATWAFT